MNEIILNFEENLENSFVDYFKKNGMQDVFASRSTETLPDQRLEIQFELTGTDDEHLGKHATTSTGENEHDRFTGVLSFALSSDRTIENTNIDGYRDNHAQRKAFLRKLMLRGSINGKVSGIKELESEYYNLYRIVFSSDTGDITEDTIDLTIIQYGISFMILPQSWSI